MQVYFFIRMLIGNRPENGLTDKSKLIPKDF